MAKKVYTEEEKLALYDAEMKKLTAKLDKRLAHLAEKRARLTEKIDKKFGDDPEKHEQEIGILHIDNDVWIDIAQAQYEDKKKTLELKYLKSDK